MNQRKAKALRKQALHHPKFPTEYEITPDSMRKKFQQTGLDHLGKAIGITYETFSIRIQHGAKKHYKTLKKGLTSSDYFAQLA